MYIQKCLYTQVVERVMSSSRLLHAWCWLQTTVSVPVDVLLPRLLCCRLLVVSPSFSFSLRWLLQCRCCIRSRLLGCLQRRQRRLSVSTVKLLSKSCFSNMASVRQRRCHSPLVRSSLSCLGGVHSRVLGGEQDEVGWPSALAESCELTKSLVIDLVW